MLLSAYKKGLAHLTRVLALLMALSDPGGKERRLEHSEQEQALQPTHGTAWLWHRSLSALRCRQAGACSKPGWPHGRLLWQRRMIAASPKDIKHSRKSEHAYCLRILSVRRWEKNVGSQSKS